MDNKTVLILGLTGIAATVFIVMHQHKNLMRLAEQGHKVQIGNAFFKAQVN